MDSEGNVKHSYGLKIGLHARQRDYTRGQTLRQWLLSAGWGTLQPRSYDALQGPGGHARHEHWARVTVLGVSIQIGVEHSISNWERRG